MLARAALGTKPIARSRIGRYTVAALALSLALAGGALAGWHAGDGAAARPAPSGLGRGLAHVGAGASGLSSPAMAPMADPVHLPVVRYRGDLRVCDGWIAVQNVGTEAGMAVLVVWGEDTSCLPRCTGPIAVECSGLIRAGQAWHVDGARLPLTARSAVVFSFNARTLAEIGAGRAGDGLVADLLCDHLRDTLVDDCNAYRVFRGRYMSGGEHAGILLESAYGPALAAEVLRSCPDTRNKLVESISTYRGVAGQGFGDRDRVFDITSYHAMLVRRDALRGDSTLYVQNGGERCASVEIWYQSDERCGSPLLCEAFTLEQGTSVTVYPAECVGAVWTGTAWIRSSEPLAVAVDVFVGGAQMTYAAVPSELRYDWSSPPEFTVGSPVAFGPVVPPSSDESRGTVHVQNLSSATEAQVRVTFLDRMGAAVGSSVDRRICPLGAARFGVPGPVDSRGGRGGGVASVRVESVAWQTDEQGRALAPANISAVAEIAQDPSADSSPRASARLARSDEAIGSDDEPVAAGPDAFAYPLLAEQSSAAQSSPRSAQEVAPGARLIAVPVALRSSTSSAATTEIAISNVVLHDGVTEYVVLVYDANGLAGFECDRLAAGGTSYVGLDHWAHLSPGFAGSAVVSAVAWQHPVSDHPRAQSAVGLAAVAVLHVADKEDSARIADGRGASLGIPFPPPSRPVPLDVGRPGEIPCVPTAAPSGGTPGTGSDSYGVMLPWVARGSSPTGR